MIGEESFEQQSKNKLFRRAGHMQAFCSHGRKQGRWKSPCSWQSVFTIAAPITFGPSCMVDLNSIQFEACRCCHIGEASHIQCASWSINSRFLQLTMDSLKRRYSCPSLTGVRQRVSFLLSNTTFTIMGGTPSVNFTRSCGVTTIGDEPAIDAAIC